MDPDPEVSLRDEWTIERLAAYGAMLQAGGDPRGELIALDLAPPTDERLQRRREILKRWLGETVATAWGPLATYGFLAELHPQLSEPLLETPLGDFVRSATVWVAPEAELAEVEERLLVLARRSRPWLTRLKIVSTGQRVCSPQLARSLTTALPALTDLYCLGQPVFASLDHPGLRRLFVIEGDVAPDTSAAVISLPRWPEPPGPYFLVEDPFELLPLLESIRTAGSVTALWSSHAAHVGVHDSVPAALLRLHDAGLVELEGSRVSLTRMAHGLLAGIVQPSNGPSFVVTPPVPDKLPNFGHKTNCYVATLRRGRQRGGSQQLGSARAFNELIVPSLRGLPLATDVHEELLRFVRFLGPWSGERAPEEGSHVVYEHPDALRDALVALLELRHFMETYGRCHLALPYILPGPDGWTWVERLVAFLTENTEQLQVAFFVYWGY